MTRPEEQHLSDMSTSWTLFFQSFDGPSEQMKNARRQFLDRYRTPVYRYLMASVGRADVADELHQEFALRFVRGDFKRLHPERGRFRYYLKTALRNLIVDYHRRRQRRPAALPADEIVAGADDNPVAEVDEEYLACWRVELLNRTWNALEQFEKTTGKPYYTILRLRSRHPKFASKEMVHQLAPQLGTAITEGWVRKRLHYARQKFADLLVEEVAQTLDDRTAEDVEEELQELGLLDHCRSAVQRYARAE